MAVVGNLEPMFSRVYNFSFHEAPGTLFTRSPKNLLLYFLIISLAASSVTDPPA